MREGEAIITARMWYAETFDLFVSEKIEVRMCKGITVHARLKKGAGRISREIQKSIALAGSLFGGKKASH